MRKRSVRLTVYLTEKEYAFLEKQIVTSGLTKQAFGLKALLGKEIRPRPCEHHPALLKTLSDISNDFGHLLHALRESGHLSEPEIALLKERNAACWKHIRELM